MKRHLILTMALLLLMIVSLIYLAGAAILHDVSTGGSSLELGRPVVVASDEGALSLTALGLQVAGVAQNPLYMVISGVAVMLSCAGIRILRHF